MERLERDAALRRIATAFGRMLVYASGEPSADRLAERLRLAGVPVLLATGPSGPGAIEQYTADATSSLVTTSAGLRGHGPVSAPIVVNTRVTPSMREYVRRVELTESPVHVSLVVPEDEPLAADLAAQLGAETPVEAEAGDPLATLLEHAGGDDSVKVSGRRRFPLAR